MEAPQGATCAPRDGVWVPSGVAATALGLGSWFGGGFTAVLGSQHPYFTTPHTQKPLLLRCQCAWPAPVARRKLGAEKTNSRELRAAWLDVK